VARDVRDGKVSAAAALADYGVAMQPAPPGEPRTGELRTGELPEVDLAATGTERDRVRAARPGGAPFFDRGPGYAALSGGRSAAELDYLDAPPPDQ
jgi:N-methylhydantoinase B